MPKRKRSLYEGAGQKVAIKLTDVPQYLQSEELFRSMQPEASATEEEAPVSAELFEVPVNCIKPDQSVNSEEDAWSLLHSLRYWIVGSDLPQTLVAFCLSASGKELPASFWKSFEDQFPSMNALKKPASSIAKDPAVKVRMAIATGDVKLVRLVHEILQCLPRTACVDAALSGGLACLQYVHDHAPRNTRPEKVVKACIEAGSLECLEFAVKEGYRVPCSASVLAAEKGSAPCLQYLRIQDVNSHICSAAARAGHLDCLRLAVEEAHLHPNLSALNDAAAGGFVACVKYAHEQGAPWSKDTCETAARNGRLECLVYLHEHGCPWNEDTCLMAARAGSLPCLQYAHEHGCPWDEKICFAAARAGSLRCLQYAHEHGCPWSEEVCKETARYGYLDCLQYAQEHDCPWTSDTCAAAAREGHLNCLRYAHEHGCPWDTKTCAAAAGAGALNCLQYAHEHGCPWDTKTCTKAARNTAVDCLNYAHKHGCPWDEEVCIMAALWESLDCLQYAHEHGCPWTSATCEEAARVGHLDCLQYAHEHGCPWDTKTCAAAAGAGALDCLQYAHEHGCPWDSSAWDSRALFSFSFCRSYLSEHGCPLPEAEILPG